MPPNPTGPTTFSVRTGVKPTYLAQHGHNPKLPNEDFGEAVQIAQAEFDKPQPDVVIGSSRGGAVAMNIKIGEARLVLLCPAWKKWGTAKMVKPGTVILHSRADDVVPFGDSEELARNGGATLTEVGTDHLLADPEPLAAMLSASEKPGRQNATTTMETKMKTLLILPILGAFLFAAVQATAKDQAPTETAAGWIKYTKNPVLGGDLGTCFDLSVLKEGDAYRMWFSWRPKKSIALVESKDGIQWSKPEIVIGPNDKADWENDLNRPVVIKNGDRYQMWYTGQARGKSWIGYATSKDGKSWKRESDKPVLSAEKPWEKVAVMCPHVIYDDKAKVYRMWYSGGEQGEPNAIGFATSEDGLKWAKHENNPVFRPDPKNDWEKERVTACQVIPQKDGFLMFYIGFRDESHAQIGVARSKDGITEWNRHPANPIIRPGKDQWDHDAVYKPYAIYDGKKWLLWYNGRRGGVEQIGLALHEGEDLGF